MKTVIFTILVFGIVIAIHEFGHFIVAKLAGVKVHEFALGMGPRLFQVKKGETLGIIGKNGSGKSKRK